MMPMSNAKQKTAKLLQGIVSATEKSSISECAIGVKQTGKEPESNHANGATGNWLPPVQKPKQRSALLKPQRQNVTKTGDGMKCLLPMAATAAPVVAKLNVCF